MCYCCQGGTALYIITACFGFQLRLFCFSSRDQIDQVLRAHTGREGQLRGDKGSSGSTAEFLSTVQATRGDFTDRVGGTATTSSGQHPSGGTPRSSGTRRAVSGEWLNSSQDISAGKSISKMTHFMLSGTPNPNSINSGEWNQR